MNLKKLAFWTTLFTTAAVPLATAQNPVILQGNYVSNVFGQSNFILNPNAQTNVANVTVSSATVTRSTTTPLVATSEFNITTSTATGYADWATRTFDAGMKNQNCEARFTYRGFSVGSTSVQIRQGSNTVAQLTLTASTDPRIASINFPCGDLSSATTLRVQQATASLTGTNELSGLYLGLATNQANVAQAEFVGGGEWNAVTFSRSSAAIQSTFAAFTTGSAGTAIGKATSAGSDSTITFSYLPAGQYYVSSNLYAYGYNISNTYVDCQFSLQEIDSNTFSGLASSGAYPTTGGIYPQVNQLQGNFSFTTGGQRRFRLVSKNAAANGASSTCNAIGDSATKSGIFIYRFPTSSELVVTPERQNTFAGIKGVASGGTNDVTSSTWTKLTSLSTLTRTSYGKAKIESNNDYSVTIENLPVGSYYVSTTGVFYSSGTGSGTTVSCFFGLSDSSGGTPFAVGQAESVGDATDTNQIATISSIGGIFQNNSVASKTFFVQGYRTSATGACSGYSDSNRPLTISVIPLDQPSNSALYVQGPVKAQGTGTAVSTGYVGEEINGTSTTGTGLECARITLTAGQWIVYGTAYTTMSSISGTGFFDIEIDASSGNLPASSGSFVRTFINANENYLLSTMRVLNTTGGTFYLNCRPSMIGGGSVVKTNNANSVMKAVRLN